eukprot:TRINITY_DN111443_c0_g1_i1.p1 TRINITY_DN111443_c0_g1~~TRINITY_DN111443_c0_g1_i1.p1  ORF type:complete len:240 (-),score=53.79 TRINITY_DN111443_c0_g1_i1:148-867(-)
MGQACGRSKLPRDDDDPAARYGAAAVNDEPVLPGGSGTHHDEPWRNLLGGPGQTGDSAGSAVAPPAGVLVETKSSRLETPKEKAPEVPVSAALARTAAFLGVKLPQNQGAEGQDEDEYGAMDDYIDDLLGTPLEDRPAHSASFRQQNTAQAAEAALAAKFNAEIIYADGRRGPAEELRPADPNQEDGQVAPSMSSSPFFENVITGWASIDKESANQQALDTKVASDLRPAPKRKAAGAS